MVMIKLNKRTIIKIFSSSFLTFFVFGIIPQALSTIPFIFQKNDTSFIGFIGFGFVFIIILPTICFLGGLLFELPYYFIYKNKVYIYENKIINSGFAITKDFRIVESILMFKTFQTKFNHIDILIKAEYSLLLKDITLLEFKSNLKIISEKLFYFFRFKSRLDKRYESSFNDITYIIDFKNENLSIETVLEGFDEFDIEKEKFYDPYETYWDLA